eukprot:8161926-Pyramimonas_sp.AAC.1
MWGGRVALVGGARRVCRTAPKTVPCRQRRGHQSQMGREYTHSGHQSQNRREILNADYRPRIKVYIKGAPCASTLSLVSIRRWGGALTGCKAPGVVVVSADDGPPQLRPRGHGGVELAVELGVSEPPRAEIVRLEGDGGGRVQAPARRVQHAHCGGGVSKVEISLQAKDGERSNVKCRV